MRCDARDSIDCGRKQRVCVCVCVSTSTSSCRASPPPPTSAVARPRWAAWQRPLRPGALSAALRLREGAALSQASAAERPNAVVEKPGDACWGLHSWRRELGV